MLIAKTMKFMQTGYNDMINKTKNKNALMRKLIPATVYTAALSSCLFVPRTLAQHAGTVTIEIGHCLALESDAARNACFGAQVREVIEENESSETDNPSPSIRNVAGNAEIISTHESSSTQTPLARHADQERNADRPDRPAAAEGEYRATIVAIRERLPSSYVITLDNGQIWEQVEPKRYPLRPGLEVRLYPTQWGPRYRLSGVGTGGHIQVRRVQ